MLTVWLAVCVGVSVGFATRNVEWGIAAMLTIFAADSLTDRVVNAIWALKPKS